MRQCCCQYLSKKDQVDKKSWSDLIEKTQMHHQKTGILEPRVSGRRNIFQAAFYILADNLFIWPKLSANIASFLLFQYSWVSARLLLTLLNLADTPADWPRWDTGPSPWGWGPRCGRYRRCSGQGLGPGWRPSPGPPAPRPRTRRTPPNRPGSRGPAS